MSEVFLKGDEESEIPRSFPAKSSGRRISSICFDDTVLGTVLSLYVDNIDFTHNHLFCDRIISS